VAAAWLALALHHAQIAQDNGAPINPAVVAAQAALESNFGQSQLARQANNLFGTKRGSSWHGATIALPTREWDGSRYVNTVAHWRVYENWTECFEDYGRIISRLSWYQDAANSVDNPRKFLEGILVKRDELGNVVEPGFATDPRYEEKVWGLIEQYNLLPVPQEQFGTVDYVKLNDPLMQRLWDAWRGEINRRTLWRIRPLTRGDGIKLDLVHENPARNAGFSPTEEGE
jgi:flagellum-specific peptidoglycan hydrolase FlgJ